MLRRLIIITSPLILFTALFVACNSSTRHTQPQGDNIKKVKPIQVATYSKKQPVSSVIYDSVYKRFRDTTYKLVINIYGNPDNDSLNNTSITFSHTINNKNQVIFSDSTYCMSRMTELADMNNDGIKDIMIFHYTGARANPTYHLYLVDTLNKRLTYVKGFEELPNPYLDSANNIIMSIALSGSEYTSFYRINHKNKLINLGHSYEADTGDSVQYERAMKLILMRDKLKHNKHQS